MTTDEFLRKYESLLSDRADAFELSLDLDEVVASERELQRLDTKREDVKRFLGTLGTQVVFVSALWLSLPPSGCRYLDGSIRGGDARPCLVDIQGLPAHLNSNLSKMPR